MQYEQMYKKPTYGPGYYDQKYGPPGPMDQRYAPQGAMDPRGYYQPYETQKSVHSGYGGTNMNVSQNYPAGHYPPYYPTRPGEHYQPRYQEYGDTRVQHSSYGQPKMGYYDHPRGSHPSYPPPYPYETHDRDPYLQNRGAPAPSRPTPVQNYSQPHQNYGAQPQNFHDNRPQSEQSLGVDKEHWPYYQKQSYEEALYEYYDYADLELQGHSAQKNIEKKD